MEYLIFACIQVFWLSIIQNSSAEANYSSIFVTYWYKYTISKSIFTSPVFVSIFNNPSSMSCSVEYLFSLVRWRIIRLLYSTPILKFLIVASDKFLDFKYSLLCAANVSLIVKKFSLHLLHLALYFQSCTSCLFSTYLFSPRLKYSLNDNTSIFNP